MDFLSGRGNQFFAFATKLAELMWLNVLTILCCVPVITAGSALTAMHRVLVQIYRDEEDKITRSFFSSFKKNFGQATIIWIIYLAYFGLLLLEHWAKRVLENSALKYLDLLIPVLAFIGVLSMSWVFVLQSRYRLSLKDTILYAFTRIIAFPIRTLCMAISLALPLVFVIYFPQFFIVLLLLGVSGTGILQTCFYNHALKVMEDDGGETAAEEKAEEEASSV